MVGKREMMDDKKKRSMVPHLRREAVPHSLWKKKKLVHEVGTRLLELERWLENKEMVRDRVVVGKYRYGKSTSLYKVGNSWLEIETIGNEKNGYSTKRWLEIVDSK